MSTTIDLSALLAEVRREQRARRARQFRAARRQAAARRGDLLHYAWRCRRLAVLFARRGTSYARLADAVEQLHAETREWALIQFDQVQHVHGKLIPVSTELERAAAIVASISDHLYALAFRLDRTRAVLRARDAWRFGISRG